jgi:Ca2+-binding EF-hand superfamily protein
MEVVAHCLQPDQIADLRKEFAKYDLKQQGEISLADLHAVLSTHAHLSEEEIVRIFKDVDIDHAGAIQYHEFLAAAICQQAITEENMRLAFERIGNHRERITSDNLCELLDEERSGTEVADIIKEIRSLPSESIDYTQVSVGTLASTP